MQKLRFPRSFILFDGQSPLIRDPAALFDVSVKAEKKPAEKVRCRHKSKK
jgi:hypothetical protein